jgi:hypothetical protein
VSVPLSAVAVAYGPDPLLASHPNLFDESLPAIPPGAAASNDFGSTLAP